MARQVGEPIAFDIYGHTLSSNRDANGRPVGPDTSIEAGSRGQRHMPAGPGTAITGQVRAIIVVEESDQALSA